MKKFRFTGALLCAAIVSFLISCGGGSTEKTATNDSMSSGDTSGKTSMAPTAVNTIVTTPVNELIVTHKVANFAKWMASYDHHDSMRMASGIHNYVIGRGWPDSNMVLIALKIDDMAKAKAFVKDPSLKKAMQQGGVTGPPSITYYTATWQDTVSINTKLRSRTVFTVKDWDAWLKSFEEGRQERMDNGITDRVIGHDGDDNKKVAIVTAIMDTAKAYAYYKSDALKKRRAASGVVGEPVRFIFQIVKRFD